MAKRLSSYVTLIPLVIAAIAISTLALCEASTWYDRPFAGILVDPEGTVSSLGLPTWDGFRQGLRYPDQILAVDGVALDASPREPPADAFNRAVDHAARAGHAAVHVRARAAAGERALDLAISPFPRLAWWLIGASSFVIGLLYVFAAAVALHGSPVGGCRAPSPRRRSSRRSSSSRSSTTTRRGRSCRSSTSPSRWCR